MKHTHYILTRWNLGLLSQNPYKIKDPDKWMETRMELFERTAMQSIQNQTCKDFKWLIAFDPLTPDSVVSKYDYCEHIEVCYEQPHIHLKSLEPQTDWLITSRFDNDDILLPDFVANIQSYFIEQTKIIDIDYMKQQGKNFRPSGRMRPNSPFLSLVEPWDANICTALGYSHTFMPDHFPSTKINKVLAFQVIHKDNLMNKF